MKQEHPYQKTYVSSFTDYGNIFKLRDLAYKNGYIENDILKREIEFKSLSAATQFVLLRPNCYSGVFHYGYKIALKRLLEDPWLYNKYIAHCEYYDANWNIVDGTSTQEQPDICTKEEIEEASINPEYKLKEIGETELNSFSTIEIINEILNRIYKIGR